MWSTINGCGKGGEKSMREVLKERGDRGVRVADCEYRSWYVCRSESRS